MKPSKATIEIEPAKSDPAMADDAPPAKRSSDVVSKLASLTMSEFPLMATGCLALVGSVSSNASVPRMMARVLDDAGDSTSSMAFPLMIVVGGGLSSFLRTTSLRRARSNLRAKLRLRFFRSVMLSPGAKSPTTAEANVMEEDIPAVAEIVTDGVTQILRFTGSVVYSTAFMIKLNLHLFFLTSGVVPLIGCGAMLFSKYVKKLRERQRLIFLDIKEFVDERVNLLQCVKLHNREFDEIEEYEKLLRESTNATRKVDLAEGLFMGGIFGCTSAAVLGVVSAGARSVRRGEMTNGGLTSFATYSFLLGMGVSGLTKAMGDLRQGLQAARRVYDIIDREVDDQQNTSPEPVNAPNYTGVRIENVSFSYNDGEELVLRDFTLELKRGKVTALVGRNGSGKSTIANLVGGLLRPTTGSITIATDGESVPLPALDKVTQRRLIGMTSQIPALFNTTVRDNITYARPDATDAQIRNALSIVGADDFTSDLDARVGKNGGELSGGQRQKLAMARILLQDPSLCMILDEPNNNMDGSFSLSDILSWNKTLPDDEQKAVLLITHRSECLKYVDEVLVLEDGKIAERGTLADLSSTEGSRLEYLLKETRAEELDQ